MKPYTLKLKDIRRKARTAYKAGLLTAQAPDSRDQQCNYTVPCHDGVERHCAIGAALPKRVLKDIAEGNRLGTSVRNLARDGYVQFAAPQERRAISEIQHLHDYWCREPTYEANFKQAIGLK